jgi:hypothetical protein
MVAPIDTKFFVRNWALPRSKIAQFERNPDTKSAPKKFKTEKSSFNFSPNAEFLLHPQIGCNCWDLPHPL